VDKILKIGKTSALASTMVIGKLISTVVSQLEQ
jgi:hypothetical protein